MPSRCTVIDRNVRNRFENHKNILYSPLLFVPLICRLLAFAKNKIKRNKIFDSSHNRDTYINTIAWRGVVICIQIGLDNRKKKISVRVLNNKQIYMYICMHQCQ